MSSTLGQRGTASGNGSAARQRNGKSASPRTGGSANGSNGKHASERLPSEILPGLPKDTLIARARSHLTELEEAQRPRINTLDGVDRSRPRRAARRVRREWIRVTLALERLKRAARSPRHPLGRRLAWWRLIAKPQKLWDFRVLAPIAGVTLAVLGPKLGLDMTKAWFVFGVIVGVPAAGTAVFLFDDFFRSPFRAWRIRRRICKHPTSLLPSAPASGSAWLIPSEHPMGGQVIPRDDLYYEVLPGILRRHHRDVQIVVGEPGSGKTTALIGLAELLARIGIVPVLVPLRGQAAERIVEAAEDTFKRQINMRVRSSEEADTLWRWLYRRKRVAVLTDDIDQIGPDGERGFVLRRTLDKLATEDLPIVVTARPAGIPAGVAASSIELGDLREAAVVSYVAKAAKLDPGADPQLQLSERDLAHWVREGRLNEAPFYLELLASLYAAGRGPELPEAKVLRAEHGYSGCFRSKPGGNWEWNPLWVRFRLLERYYEEMENGGVRRWLGIEQHERQYSLRELQKAALGMLRLTGYEAKAHAAARVGGPGPGQVRAARSKLQDFLETDDRAIRRTKRDRVSTHEVVDTGERLRVVDRDEAGELQFRHRIMQAYLAGRRLADDELDRSLKRARKGILEDQLSDLLDAHHPEKLTAHMAICFAALRLHDQGQRSAPDKDSKSDPIRRAADATCRAVLGDLIADAQSALAPTTGARRAQATESVPSTVSVPQHGWPEPAHENDDGLDPRVGRDPEARTDPDDALLKLTTAAEIALAIDDENHRNRKLTAKIVGLVHKAHGATRWTKLGAIASIAALHPERERWTRIWEFARDPDYKVRRAASAEIEKNANVAYRELQQDIVRLILRAAARSSMGLTLLAPPRAPNEDAEAEPNAPRKRFAIEPWEHHNDVLALKALGWILPAIVSGLREEPSGQSPGPTIALNGSPNGDRSQKVLPPEAQAAYVRSARQALEWLVALAFEGGHHDLEASVAQGFKSDAMRHAEDPEQRITGPGWVASNRRLVADICLAHSEFWYARMLLHQSLALYAIAGASREETFESFARFLGSGGERHRFVYRAAKLARRAVERRLAGSGLWTGLIWNNEAEVVARRATMLDDDAALLVADVTLLLNLNELSSEDRQAQFGYMRDLPHCLGASPNRREILGAGCPAKCGWGLCPYKQPPPDEPNAHRGVSRAFCRQQQQIAARRFRAPSWQRVIRRRKLEDFWWEMERRVRT